MAWKETCPLKQKIQFIAEWLKKEKTMTQLCEDFNISRKTGYQIIARFEEEDLEGLKPRSKAPHSHPDQVDNEIAQIILRTKKRFPKWGPKKIKSWLEINMPNQNWPVSSTIGKIFKRHGLVKLRKRRYKTPFYSKPFMDCIAPNMVWSADFKGHFRLGNGFGKYCYPLTISDNYSRFLISCKGFYDTQVTDTKKHFEKIFKEYGLPLAIRTDNGKPFASPGLGGFTQLSVWWLKLGIIHERIKPGHPEQNGRHERMHRTLKEATAMPPYSTFAKQQRAFNRFKKEYNDERPHEALEQKRPSDFYIISERKYPVKLPTIEYDLQYIVRKVGRGGEISWNGRTIFISESLRREYVGLKEVKDGIWQVYFSTMQLAELDYRKGKIIPSSKV